MHSRCLILVFSNSAVKSFFARIMPKLFFTSMTKINGSIQYTVEYVVRAAEWIKNLLETRGGGSADICPFQFDLCIAVGEPEQCDDMVGDEDDDSDRENDDDANDGGGDDDSEQEFPDYIGDIGHKLKNNELKNTKKVIAAKIGMNRFFDDLFDQFLEDNKIRKKNQFSYLHSKRLISMVDRRGQSKGLDEKLMDDVYMYEPPLDSLNIPKNAVPEWYIASSRICLLPGLDVCSRYIPGTFFHFVFQHFVNGEFLTLSGNMSFQMRLL